MQKDFDKMILKRVKEKLEFLLKFYSRHPTKRGSVGNPKSN